MLKLPYECIKFNSPSDLSSQERVQLFFLIKSWFILATLITNKSETFLDSVLPKINLTPNAVKTAKKCLIDAWKKIDQVLLLLRNVYNFSQINKKVYCGHTHYKQKWNVFLHLQGDLFYLPLLKAKQI